MIAREYICQRCGNRFVVELLDPKDPVERNLPGAEVRCPKCRSQYVEPTGR